MKNIRTILAAAAMLSYGAAAACTNFIVTKGASTDGSVMVSYAADSHSLYEISLAIARVVITAREGKEGLFVSRLDLFSDDEDDEE